MPDEISNTFDISSLMPAFAMFSDSVTRITEAYLAHNPVPVSDIPLVVKTVQSAVFGMLNVIGDVPNGTEMRPTTKATAAEIRKSISNEHLISFEDGRPYKTLKRHLTSLGITPETYRAKWGLPPNYPMTSAAYSEKRSRLAKSWGFGTARLPSSSVATH